MGQRQSSALTAAADAKPLHTFAEIHAFAVAQHGSSQAVEERLQHYWAIPKTADELAAMDDAEALSAIAKTIFQAGFSWKVVEQKWPEISQAMDDFNPYAVAMWPDERLEALLQDRRVIRHYTKLQAIRENAQWLLEVAGEHGSFCQWLAAWPREQLVELVLVCRKQGSRLGGNSAFLALRRMGKDSFVMTPDVVRALQREQVIDPQASNPVNTKAGLYAAQNAFNVWQAQSGRGLQDISRILAMTVA